MQITITSRNGRISEGIRVRTTERLRRLERYEARPLRAEFYFNSERGRKTVEGHVAVAGGGLFVAQGVAPSFASALDAALERLARQLRRQRERHRNHQADKLTL